MHYAANRALAESVPYTVVLVSLDEAPAIRVVGNIPGTDVHIGMPVVARVGRAHRRGRHGDPAPAVASCLSWRTGSIQRPATKACTAATPVAGKLMLMPSRPIASNSAYRAASSVSFGHTQIT